MGAHRALVERDAEFRLDPSCKIGTPPAHHTVAHRVRPGFDPSRKLRHLIRREPGLDPTAAAVGQPVDAFHIIAVYPVPKSLPIHAAALSRLFAGRALKHQRNRQHPPRHPAILHPACRRTQILRSHVVARNLHRHVCLHIACSD